MANAQLDPAQHHIKLTKLNTPRLDYQSSEADLKSWQRSVHNTVAKLSGFKHMDTMDRCPLKVRRVWQQEHALGSMEKLIITVEPGCDANIFVCIPHARKNDKQMPWMICLQGHSTGAHNSIGVELDDNFKTKVIEGDRDLAISCMENGVAAVCLEQRGFGERRHNVNNGTDCYMASMQALALGRSMIAERVYDVDRVIDYLYTRKDVDRKRIGVMGNSGGGTTTLFAAALLKRLTFAMPSCYFCTFEHSIMGIHHCLCNFVPSIQLEAEMADIIGSFAPKPLVVVAGKDDPIFPIKSVRSAFRALKKIYADAGAEDKVKLTVGPEGHRFYADQAWKEAHKVFDWS